jgi:lipid-binding SYLF domain-containing protein
MRVMMSAVAIAAVLGTATTGAAASKHADRIREAAAVLKDIHSQPDKDIPQQLWDKAECAIVIPNLKKAAFIVGGEYGKGLMSCRQGNGWSAPVFMELEKGSWGLQIGAQSIDLVLLVMNKNGIDKLLNNKVTLGVDASAAAGPVGRNASAATDAQMHSEILSYSRAQGLFAGIDISGGALKPDKDDTADVYGKEVDARTVLTTASVKPPADVMPFMNALRRDVVATSGKK